MLFRVLVVRAMGSLIFVVENALFYVIVLPLLPQLAHKFLIQVANKQLATWGTINTVKKRTLLNFTV